MKKDEILSILPDDSKKGYKTYTPKTVKKKKRRIKRRINRRLYAR